MLNVQNSDGSPYMNLQEVSPDGSHHNISTTAMMTSQGLVSTTHHNLITTYAHIDSAALHAANSNPGTTPMSASHATLSALLSGQITSDNSQEGVE